MKTKLAFKKLIKKKQKELQLQLKNRTYNNKKSKYY